MLITREDMKSLRSNHKASAFTLIEMSCVIGVILILAALLLPVLDQGKYRARRVQCANNLKETGVAFHVFAHDHQDRFPMRLPAAEGGSLEFVRNAYQVRGQFYFSFHHFAPLSNGLATPRPLHCPADLLRTTALDFASFKNENLSYFVGVTSDFQQPNSILAGDRNITNRSSVFSIVRSSVANPIEWTVELHRFKGNVLFADGRVNQLNEVGLSRAASDAAATADFFLPSPQPPTAIAASTPAPPVRSVEKTTRKNSAFTNASPRSLDLFGSDPFGPMIVRARTTGTVETVTVSNSVTSAPIPIATPPTPTTSSAADSSSIEATIDSMADVVREYAWILYLLLILLLTGIIAMALRHRPSTANGR